MATTPTLAQLELIDNGHYHLTDSQAGLLARQSPLGRLPAHGYETSVTLGCGTTGYLLRTPYRNRRDSPKRGWVWCVHVYHSPSFLTKR